LKARVLSLFLILTAFLTVGCAGIPRHRVDILPSPVRNFPPVKAGVVRLPVEITFPGGGDIFRHASNLFKGGLKQLAPDMWKMPGLNLKSHMGALWAEMQVPILLDDGLWLLIRPETLSVGMMRTDLKRASTAHTVLEMTARPEIVFGPKPFTSPRLMPALSRFKPGPGTFRAMTNTRVSYAEANQYFRDPRLKLIGMVLPGTGERKLTLEGIRLYGSGGKVIAEVKLHYNPPIINFTGKPAKLTVYLRGTPRYLPKERVFDLPDLDFDIKSNDLMLQVADWIFKSDFKNELRRIARLPIGPKMDVIKGKMNVALNRPLGRFTRLHTQVNALKVLDGFADNEGVEVQLAVQGTATMEVIWN
jgi:hypothetical protein